MRTATLLLLLTASVCQAQQRSAPAATAAEDLKLLPGFRAELLYSVPKQRQGSWVNMCVDPRGRLIVSDQYGGLYRVTAPPLGAAAGPDALKIERIDINIGEAQGLLWAFDSLYVVVNRGRRYDSGVYRARDTDGDDQLDSLETLRKLDGGGEHGPHAVLLAPDGESLYIVCGDGTRLTNFSESRVPRVWDEDLLLPRTYGRGFMKGTPAPGGYICRIDPDGKNWELVATGFRNQFDAALSADGELFTYDADMEWDMNTPWYRPTRVCHVVSGAEFGWRNGSGKWPEYYPDSVPAAVDVGPGSPTGMVFGYGARFPAKYQRALFICDWSYGKLYAAHLQARGASFAGQLEEFVSGAPLPLTDVVVNPQDGAMYFAIGGRRVQSGLYRVTYAGDESTEAADLKTDAGQAQRQRRQALEALHVGEHEDAVEQAWPALADADRFVRYAARVAVEHQPPQRWRQRALQERSPQAALAALLALVRQVPRAERPDGPELDTPPPHYPAEGPRHELQAPVLEALGRLQWDQLSPQQRIELLRVYTLTFLRLGPPTEETRQRLIDEFNPRLPAGSPALNSEVAQLLVYLQSPQAAAKLVELLESAPTQEQQIDYAKTLRHLRAGWTRPLQSRYLQWFVRAGGYRGGASFRLFVDHIKEDAVAQLSEADRAALQEVIDAPPATAEPQVAPPRPLVKQWTLDELLGLVDQPIRGRDYDNGRKMFAAAKCFACHRFANEGGAVGPDLTSLSGRFSPRDILESIVEPSKVISDQYQAVQIRTTGGKTIVGRIVNLAGDDLRINTDMLDPDAQVGVNRNRIERMAPSKVSMMPDGLLNTLNEEEILDLMAYLLSRGDRNAAVFD